MMGDGGDADDLGEEKKSNQDIETSDVDDLGKNEKINEDIETGTGSSSTSKFLPVLIFPGFMSSGLEIKKSGVSEEWEGERAWLNLEKLGFKSLHGSRALTADEPPGERTFREIMHQNYERRLDCENELLQHICLSHDLTTERKGNEVRPIQGLKGVDYLGKQEKQFLLQHVINMLTYVFGPVIDVLKAVGYDDTNLDAAPYDWRVPPIVLEERDQYFSNTMMQVERLYSANSDTPLVLLCHSMGCRICHYFLNFALESPRGGQAWLDKHIHTFLPVGAPHLGAPKSLRAIVHGDKMGLDAFLSDEEGLIFGRSLGSTLLLLPYELPFRNAPPNAAIRNESAICITISPIDCKEFIGELKPGEDPPKIQLKIKYGENSLRTEFQEPVGDNLTVHFKHQFMFPCHPTLPTANPDETPSDVFQIKLRQPGIEKAARTTHTKLMSCCCTAAIMRLIDHIFAIVKFCLHVSYTILRSLFRSYPETPLPSVQDAKDIAEDAGAKIASVNLALSSKHSSAQILSGKEEAKFSTEIVMAGKKAYFHRKAVSVECDLKFRNIREKGKHIQSTFGPVAIPAIAGAKYARHGLKDTEDGDSLMSYKDKNVEYGLDGGGNALLYGEGMEYVFNVLKEKYDSDPLGPRTRSCKDAPPVKRVKAIYGVNVPTEVGAVYRRSSLILTDGKLQRFHKLDTTAILSKHMHEYKINGGIVSETVRTPQVILGPSLTDDRMFNYFDATAAPKKTCMRYFTSCCTDSPIQKEVTEGELVLRCGDGTVPYWSLQHCRTWQGQCDVSVDEIEGAEHREILANSTFHKVLVNYVTQGTAHLPERSLSEHHDEKDDK